MRPSIYTVGHSTRSSEELLAPLRAARIGYRHEPDLGGHRKLRGGARNAGLKEEAFRAYADHMASPAFRRAVERLRRDACARTTATLCAEASPERCHRKLLADHLATFGLEVVHLLRPGEREAHRLSPLARAGTDGVLRYPAPGGKQLDLFGGA